MTKQKQLRLHRIEQLQNDQTHEADLLEAMIYQKRLMARMLEA